MAAEKSLSGSNFERWNFRQTYSTQRKWEDLFLFCRDNFSQVFYCWAWYKKLGSACSSVWFSRVHIENWLGLWPRQTDRLVLWFREWVVVSVDRWVYVLVMWLEHNRRWFLVQVLLLQNIQLLGLRNRRKGRLLVSLSLPSKSCDLKLDDSKLIGQKMPMGNWICSFLPSSLPFFPCDCFQTKKVGKRRNRKSKTYRTIRIPKK